MKARWYTKETISGIGIYDRGFPLFKVGDTIAVSQIIKEAGKERLQIFEGDVLAMHRNGISTTFTVRKIGANAIAAEKIYPYYSPLIDSIAIVRRGKVRRAKLYYIRKRVGKAARIQEKLAVKAAPHVGARQENSSIL